MAMNCTVVFHLATLVTGTETRSSARNSRRPDTNTSRDRMIIAGPDMRAVDRAVGGQHEKNSRHQNLVGDRDRACGPGPIAGAHLPREIAVEEIGDRRADEEGERRPARAVAAPQDETRHHRHCDKPAIGQHIGQA